VCLKEGAHLRLKHIITQIDDYIARESTSRFKEQSKTVSCLMHRIKKQRERREKEREKSTTKPHVLMTQPDDLMVESACMR
jgi:hypothetical protein